MILTNNFCSSTVNFPPKCTRSPSLNVSLYSCRAFANCLKLKTQFLSDTFSLYTASPDVVWVDVLNQVTRPITVNVDVIIEEQFFNQNREEKLSSEFF